MYFPLQELQFSCGLAHYIPTRNYPLFPREAGATKTAVKFALNGRDLQDLHAVKQGLEGREGDARTRMMRDIHFERR